MATYVDELRIVRKEQMPGIKQRFPYLHSCHLIADSQEELLAMAKKIGLNPNWIQKKGQPEEHFDLTKRKREEALSAGAKGVTDKLFITIIRGRRGGNWKLRKGQPCSHCGGSLFKYRPEVQESEMCASRSCMVWRHRMPLKKKKKRRRHVTKKV